MIESQDKDPDEIIKSVIEKTSFLSQFEDNTEENLDKKMNVSELVNSAKEFSKLNKDATLTDYLGSITLSSDTDELNEGNFVTIATVHAVKGLEFDSAFIVGLDETIFPISRACDSDEELEEERRLMYVAITRAKTNLYLTRAKSRYLYGNRSVTAESRFVKEIKPLVYEKGGSYYEPKPQQPTQSYVDRHKRNNGADDYGYYPDEPSSGSSYSKSFSSRYNMTGNLKPQTTNKGSKTYTSGMKVMHKKFGLGTIIAVKNDGKLIDVAFSGVGIKSLATDYAPIEVV